MERRLRDYVLARIEATDLDLCWVWTGTSNIHGYGVGRCGGKSFRAHRLACELAYGPSPPGTEACHSCGYRACVNPLHLYWGTHSENMLDRTRHGYTGTRGSKSSVAKLDEYDIQMIRKALEDGKTQRAIAEVFDVSYQTIWGIKHGRTWRHI